MPNPLGFIPRQLRVPVRVGRDWMDHVAALNIGLISAGVAFYAFLALFPTLTAVIALWGIIADPDVVQSELSTFEPLLPEDVYLILSSQIRQLASAPTQTLGWATAISIGGAIWAMRSGVAALVRGLNTAYQVRARTGIRHMLAALSLTLILVLIALVALATVVFAPVALALLPLGPWTGTVLNAMRWFIGMGMVLLGISMLYKFGPNRPAAGTPWLSLGAVLALGLWAIVSVGFSFYLENFGSYDKVYGSLGAVIALLMWFYLSAYVVLVGAMLNVARERRPTVTP